MKFGQDHEVELKKSSQITAVKWFMVYASASLSLAYYHKDWMLRVAVEAMAQSYKTFLRL
jgi:hypothetical protein